MAVGFGIFLGYWSTKKGGLVRIRLCYYGLLLCVTSFP
ncbi:hypothetical protein VPHD479_0258 [Vibrio phage D479]